MKHFDHCSESAFAPTRSPLLAPVLAALCLLAAALPASALAVAADPTFGEQTATAGVGGSEIWGIASGDLNGDGRDDVVTANHRSSGGNSSLGVQFGNADGTLAEPVEYGLPANGAMSAALGDFDGDGDLDVVGVSEAGATVFANDGDGALTEDETLGGGFGAGGAAAGDFNRDGDLDLAVVFGPEAQIFLGDGDLGFEAGTPVGFDDESWGLQLVVADFEGDGSADLAATLYDNSSAEILTSDDDGTFTSRGTYRAGCCGRPEGLAAADLDADGRDDLVVAERWGNRIFSVLTGGSASGPTFTVGPKVQIPDGPYEANPIWVATGDLNGDGLPDAATADYMNDSLTVFVGDGAGGFAISETLFPTYPGIQYFAPHANAIDDFDGDGRLDLAVASQEPPVVTYLNEGEPAATIEPISHEFALQPVGFPSAPLSVHVENEGNAALDVNAAALVGEEADEFSVDASQCLDAPVLVGVGCDVEVAFWPLETGGASAMLKLESDNPGGDLEASLGGFGITPAPEVTIEPGSIEFGQRKVGTVSAGETIEIGNDGFADLNVGGIALEGAATADFELMPASCATATIAPGAECEFEVAFAPGSAGARLAEVVISSDDAGGPIEVALDGTGTEPQISAAPVALGFADQAAGSESEFQSIAVENQGDAALGIGAIAKSGADRLDFSVYAAGCVGTTLAPGESCSLAVSFRPTQPGERAAAIEIGNDGPSGALTVPLSGTATGAGPAPGRPVPPAAERAAEKPGEPVPNARFTRKPRSRIEIAGPALERLRVGFASSRAGSSFQCSLDGRLFRLCAPPLTLKNLAPGRHKLRVRAIGPSGLIGPVATARFSVVSRR